MQLITHRFNAYFLIILYVEDYVPVLLTLFDICVCFMDFIGHFYSGSLYGERKSINNLKVIQPTQNKTAG